MFNRLQEAFDKFINEDFEKTVDLSTEAYYAGSKGYYTVQFCTDGTYKVLWSEQDNLPNLPPGVLMRVPFLFEGEVGYNDIRDFFTAQFHQILDLLLLRYEDS